MFDEELREVTDDVLKLDLKAAPFLVEHLVRVYTSFNFKELLQLVEPLLTFNLMNL